jgi:hypothetical protein
MGLDPATATIGAAVIGGVMSKPSKQKAPAQRSYLGEMQDALNAQSGIQGQLLGQEARWTPAYQELQRQTLQGQMGMLGGLYREAGGISAGLQSDYLGMQAPIYGEVGQASLAAYQQSLDPQTRGLYASMMGSAQNDLSAGRELTPQMQQLAQQTARQAMAARGLSGNQAVAQEVLNSYQMQDARENRARQFASQMYGAGTQQTASAMGMFGNPLMTQLNAVSPTALLGTAGQMSQGLGTKIFQPESQYNAALQSNNQGIQAQINSANAQAQAGWASGLMGMAGSLGGALLKNPNIVGGSNGSGYIPQFNSSTGYGSSLNSSTFNPSLGAGGGNLSFSSGAMYNF